MGRSEIQEGFGIAGYKTKIHVSIGKTLLNSEA